MGLKKHRHPYSATIRSKALMPVRGMVINR